MRAYRSQLFCHHSCHILYIALKLFFFLFHLQLDKSAKFSGFADHNLSDGLLLIKLIEKIKPSSVDWKVVNQSAQTYDVSLFILQKGRFLMILLELIAKLWYQDGTNCRLVL